MKEDDYRAACRYKEAIKLYEEKKLKIMELYKKVKESAHDDDVMALAEMIFDAVEDETGKKVLEDLISDRIVFYNKCIKGNQELFERI
jgi:hypothetical protein